MRLTQIQKLYLSNFLTGLVFWYGIEKIFMTSIGIDAVGVGVVSAFTAAVTLLLQIPGGLLADKWSRKGTLIVSALALAVSSVILGLANGLPQYLIGTWFYCIFLVLTYGVYQAIVYDSLYDENRTHDYSKVWGRAYGLFLAGSGVANVFSGFISEATSFRAAFFLSVAPCILNAFVLLAAKEPKHHKKEQREKILPQLSVVGKGVMSDRFLRALVIVFTTTAVVEVFKLDFGQLYIMRYVSAPQGVGLLWAMFAFLWAAGSLVAHKLSTRLSPLIFVSLGALIVSAMFDNVLSLGVMGVNIMASAALVNQIETRIQDNTPSVIRASVLSALSVLGSVIAVPTGLFTGWVIREYSPFEGIQLMALLAVITLIYWVIERRHLPRIDKKMTAAEEVLI